MFIDSVDAAVRSEVTIASGASALDARAWRELVAGSPADHLFASPEWQSVWWAEFQEGKELFVLTFSNRDGPLGVIPLYRKHEEGRKVLRFVGGIDLTDYLGPICSPENRPALARALVTWLQTTDLTWDEFDAHNLPVPHGFAEPFVEMVDRAGFDYRLEQEETAAILLLPREVDEYMASLMGKERHELKRKRRRIYREHPDTAIRSYDHETLDVDLKTFFAMHRGADGHKGHFMKPNIETFFERVAATFDELGWLRLDFLEISGIPIAATFGFEVGSTLYLYNSAYEPEYRRLSPGLILVAGLIEEAIAKGLGRFDFMRGPERYKYQLGAEAVPLNNVRVFAPRKGQ